MTDLLEFVEHVHDISVDRARQLRFNKDFHIDGALMCSYATLIEHTGGLIALANSGKRTSSTAVFRSLLEAFVDFKNLFADRAYLQNMLAKYHEEWSLLLKEAIQGDNPILVDLSRAGGIHEALAQYEGEKNELKKRGIRSLRIRERFRLAGMEHEFTSVYMLASSGAHNDFAALLRRHAVMGESENDYGLHIYKSVDKHHFRSELHGAVSFLITASWMVHDYLKSSVKAEFEALVGDLERVAGSE